MKIHLASFKQKENFGSGRVISVVHGDKPKDISVSNIYKPLTPATELIAKYNDEALSERQQGIKSSDGQAGKNFDKSYREQLATFVENVLKTAKEEGVSPQDLLPLKEGDTLCSWERCEYTHYRATLAEYLRQLGYEVVQK